MKFHSHSLISLQFNCLFFLDHSLFENDPKLWTTWGHNGIQKFTEKSEVKSHDLNHSGWNRGAPDWNRITHDPN
jgi:hypothetical protein